VRDLRRFDVPDAREILDVRVVGPVAKAGQVAVGAVSRVFCAVGWPLNCSTLAPGRPSAPRMRLMLLTCTAAAVA
jgi:hypothetical protein